MRITFVLPDITPEPNGGVKIVYDYANLLVERGHQVNVVHPRTWDPLAGVAQAVKSAIWPHMIRIKHGGATPWLSIKQGVRQLLVPDLSARSLPDADVIVATFFRTAPYVDALPIQKGAKAHLVQGYETWSGSEEDVHNALRLPMAKITCSTWLKDLLCDLQQRDRTTVVFNAVDFDTMFLEKPITERAPHVAMLYHDFQLKGSLEGLEVLQKVKQNIPKLDASLFGTAPPRPCIPDWMHYCQTPTRQALRHLYNEAGVFLQPSRSEGWGLTSTEAMACGCALITTDNGGSRDFAIHEKTALVVPVGDTQAMEAALLRLLKDDELRLAIAQGGNEFVQQFTWSRAVESMEKALTGIATGAARPDRSVSEAACDRSSS